LKYKDVISIQDALAITVVLLMQKERVISLAPTSWFDGFEIPQSDRHTRKTWKFSLTLHVHVFMFSF
jgi:hypothetical protein